RRGYLACHAAEAIDRASDLPRLVGGTKPGSRATLTVFRRGATRDLQVQIAEIEPERAQRRAAGPAQPESRPQASAAAQSLGIGVVDLTDAQKRELKLKGGVRVETVADPATRAGLREGDVIVSVGNTEVANVREFDAAISKIDRTKPVPLLLRRGELATYLLIRPQR
ncbi:MAG: PDZ domain-containing protein, partial [Pseudomonadota bacterium]